MLEREFKFYQDHKEDLMKKYNNRYVAIKGDAVLADFSSREEAIEATQKEHAMGTFLIQFVSSEEDPVQRFYSRVDFDDTEVSSPSSLHD